jgi:dihydropyrimidinase
MSILLKGGKVVNFDASVVADVLINNGVIAEIGPNLIAGDGVRVVDVTNKLVMPGGIDPHTHFNLPFVCSLFPVLLFSRMSSNR